MAAKLSVLCNTILLSDLRRSSRISTPAEDLLGMPFGSHRRQIEHPDQAFRLELEGCSSDHTPPVLPVEGIQEHSVQFPVRPVLGVTVEQEPEPYPSVVVHARQNPWVVMVGPSGGNRVQAAREHLEPAHTAMRDLVSKRLKMKSRLGRFGSKLPENCRKKKFSGHKKGSFSAP